MNVRTLLIIVSLVILLASGAAYTVFALVGPTLGVTGPDLTSASSRAGDTPGPMFEIGPLMVNLSTNGQPGVRYVRAGIVLEVDSEKTRRALERREPPVKDRVISIVRVQTTESISGSEGQEQLRESLLQSVNELLPEGHVVQVWFTDLVVQ